MGLSSSLSTALTGLRVSQQSIGVLSQNIANANNEGYTRQVVSQSAIAGNDIAGSGVSIDGVARVVDDFLNGAVITRSSQLARAQVIDSYYDQSQIIIGQPGQANSIDSYTQNFFESLQTLSIDTENSSLKLSAVDSASTLADEISNLARGIEELRYQADKEIEQSAGIINSSIDRIFDLNIAVGSATALGQSVNTFADQIEAEMAVIAEQMNISYEFDDQGKVSISTSGGALLINSSNRFHVRYDAANSVQEFIDDSPRTAVELVRVSEDGVEDDLAQAQLVSAGNRTEVTSELTGGKIQGLVEMRDTLFPNILDQLDNFVAVVRDEVNAIYNNGTPFPPETSLTGTTIINPIDQHSWSGSVIIGAVQVGSITSDGQPVASPYPSQTTGIKPLELDLGALQDNAEASGFVSFQSIIDEINSYYGVPQDRASIGDISNIELLAKSDSLAAGTGSFDFNLETTNLSGNDRNFTVTGITTSDPNITVTTPAAFPTSAFTSTAGGTDIASATNFSLDFSNGAIGAGPYDIEVAISVDDGAGGFYTDTIIYSVNQRADGLINDRFPPTAVSGAGDAVIESPNTNQRVLTASLVDADGNEVAKDPFTGEYQEAGFLHIEGADGVGIALSEQNSQHLGNAVVDATNYGFSHYFGMNNFFVTGDGTDPSAVADAAITLHVRDDIAAAPGKISIGTLKQSSQSTVAGDPPLYTYEVSSGGNETILALDALANTPIGFPAAGGISRTTVTFNNYAAQILGYTATVSANAEETARKEELIYQGFADKKDSVGGVNIDEEIANTIVFQNAYASNARVISVIEEMFDALLAAF